MNYTKRVKYQLTKSPAIGSKVHVWNGNQGIVEDVKISTEYPVGGIWVKVRFESESHPFSWYSLDELYSR